MQFTIRQRSVYYEDFKVEADSAQEAIDKVNDGNETGMGPEYLETTNTYLLDEAGVFQAAEQPENATPLPRNN